MFDQSDDQEVAVHMSRSIYRRLLREAIDLKVPIEWLLASLVADTIEDDLEKAPDAVAA